MIVRFLAEVQISGWLFPSVGIPITAVSWLVLVDLFSSHVWSLVTASPVSCNVCCSTVFFICSKSQRISGIVQVLDRNTPMLGNTGVSASAWPATVSTCSDLSTLSGITPVAAVAPAVVEACHVLSRSAM